MALIYNTVIKNVAMVVNTTTTATILKVMLITIITAIISGFIHVVHLQGNLPNCTLTMYNSQLMPNTLLLLPLPCGIPIHITILAKFDDFLLHKIPILFYELERSCNLSLRKRKYMQQLYRYIFITANMAASPTLDY